jgi:hypothetical protein
MAGSAQLSQQLAAILLQRAVSENDRPTSQVWRGRSGKAPKELQILRTCASGQEQSNSSRYRQPARFAAFATTVFTQRGIAASSVK